MSRMSITSAFVPTQVRYLASRWRESKELPRIYDRESRRANSEKIDVMVRDARQTPDAIQLEVNGFELFKFASPVTDFTDSGLITNTYYPAVAEFVKETTNASEIFISNHLIRTEDKSDFNKAYARFVHCDYDVDSARSFSLKHLQNRKIDVAGYESAEFAWYNSWQPFDHPVQENPLAMLDATTIQRGDIGKYVYGGRGTSLESSIPLHRAEHQFYYYENMTQDEVLLIKQLDTRPGHARVSPHTSFIDPNSPADALPRRSIEVRMLAVFT